MAVLDSTSARDVSFEVVYSIIAELRPRDTIPPQGSLTGPRPTGLGLKKGQVLILFKRAANELFRITGRMIKYSDQWLNKNINATVADAINAIAVLLLGTTGRAAQFSAGALDSIAIAVHESRKIYRGKWHLIANLNERLA